MKNLKLFHLFENRYSLSNEDDRKKLITQKILNHDEFYFLIKSDKKSPMEFSYNETTGLFDIFGNLNFSNTELEYNSRYIGKLKFGNVTGDFDCRGNKLKSLEKVSPKSVGGNFKCSYNFLTSLIGAPQIIKGSLDCSFNDITSLDGSPETINGDFLCQSNKLTSLKGAPQIIKGSLHCGLNHITSLVGSPKTINGDFLCQGNKLTSLKGAPQTVGRSFDLTKNHLTSLEGSPQIVGRNFNLNENDLTSLKGAPQTVGGDFICSRNKLTSLKGSPKTVGSGFDCRFNPLTSLKGAPLKIGHVFKCDDFVIKSDNWNPRGWFEESERSEKSAILLASLLSEDNIFEWISLNPEMSFEMQSWIRKNYPDVFGKLKAQKKADDTSADLGDLGF